MNNNFIVDGSELLNRIIKYAFEGIIVAFAAFFIPGKNKMSYMDIITIGIIAAATFSLLDLFAPSIGSGVRNGAGLGIGFNLVGTNMVGGGAPMFR
jgi:hypothetical protein